MESLLLTRLSRAQGMQRWQGPGPCIQGGYSDVRLITMPTARAYVKTFFLQTRNRFRGCKQHAKVTQLLGNMAKARIHSPHFGCLLSA